MTRLGDDAVAYALSRVGGAMPDSGLCLQWTREPFAIGALYGSAVDAWYGSNHRVPGDRNPPPAVPVWFDSSSIYEHVAFHCGDGVIVSTFNAEIRRFESIGAMETVYGPYAGWGPGLNEVQVWWPPTTPAPEMEDDVKALIYTDGTPTWWLYDGLTKRELRPGEPDQLVDLGLITREQLDAGPKWLPATTIDGIPDA
ncbi:hypothetical protein [Cellulomonas sp. URHB0016]